MQKTVRDEREVKNKQVGNSVQCLERHTYMKRCFNPTPTTLMIIPKPCHAMPPMFPLVSKRQLPPSKHPSKVQVHNAHHTPISLNICSSISATTQPQIISISSPKPSHTHTQKTEKTYTNKAHPPPQTPPPPPPPPPPQSSTPPSSALSACAPSASPLGLAPHKSAHASCQSREISARSARYTAASSSPARASCWAPRRAFLEAIRRIRRSW